MYRWKCIINTVIMYVIFIMLCAQVFAQETVLTQNITVIGSARIHEKDTSKAKAEAIENSLIGAVQQAVISLFPIDQIVDDFSGINKIVREKKDQFIQSYKILAESKSDTAISVLVEVTIFPEYIKKSIRFVEIKPTQEPYFPKIAFLISEKDMDNPVPRFWWGKGMAAIVVISEKALSEVMAGKGFPIVDHRSGHVDIPPELINKPDLNESEAAEIGKRLNAEIVVFGKSMVYESYKSNDQSKPSYSGTLAVHALRTDTGEIIASSVRTKLAPSPLEVLTSVANMAGDDIASKLIELSKKSDSQPKGMLKILVGGTNFLTNLVAFRRMLSALPSVSDVQTSEMTMDKAVLIVAFNGTAEDLAEELILKNFDSFTIQINEISKNQLKIELVPK